MIESLTVTLFPTLFLIVLFGGEVLFRRKDMSQGGKPPIEKTPYYISKYLILVMWGAMVAQSWGLNLVFVQAPEPLRWVSVGLWGLGFMLLFVGRFGLGTSFRIGSPLENTRLAEEGLFRLSRNPMYLGVYATLLALVLYTLNPILFFIAAFIVAVHHRIVLAEERHLREVFGEEYMNYCGRVRRYL